MEMWEYSDEIVQVVEAFLKQQEWDYLFNKEVGDFKFDLKIGGRLQTIKYEIDVREDEMIVYGTSPISADFENEEMMKEMAFFTCDVNYGLSNGNLELDRTDGGIYFKTHVDYNGMVPSIAAVRNSIHVVTMMFTCYAEGIIDIIFNNGTAKSAMEKSMQFLDDELARLKYLSDHAEI